MVLVYRTTGVLNIAHGGVGVLVRLRRLGPDHAPRHAVLAGRDGRDHVRGRARSGLRTVDHPQPRRPTRPADGVDAGAVPARPVPWCSSFRRGATPGGSSSRRRCSARTSRSPAPTTRSATTRSSCWASASRCSCGLHYLLRRTRLGMAMRAVSDDATAAQIMGVRQSQISPVVWGLAFGLSGLTTMLLAPILFLDNTSLTSLTLKAVVWLHRRAGLPAADRRRCHAARRTRGLLPDLPPGGDGPVRRLAVHPAGRRAGVGVLTKRGTLQGNAVVRA